MNKLKKYGIQTLAGMTADSSVVGEAMLTNVHLGFKEEHVLQHFSPRVASVCEELLQSNPCCHRIKTLFRRHIHNNRCVRCGCSKAAFTISFASSWQIPKREVNVS